MSRPIRGGDTALIMPIMKGDTAQVTSCQGRGHGSGQVLSGEGSQLRSRPVMGVVTAQVMAS